MRPSIASIVLWAVCLTGGALANQDELDGNNVDDAPTRDHGNSIEVDKIGLPIYTTLNGSVTNLNEILPSIHLNRTKAFLNCSQGSMQVELMFQEPFYGLAYADFDRNSACMTKGRGLDSARIELPLKGCGTVQDPPRVFTNNIVVRFHPGLEMDGDEVITIVCRYPPARAEKPGPLLAHRESPPPAAPILSGFHILLMICTLLFLALLLLGLGCSYMCLKRRPVPVVHHQQFAGSEITKVSGSSALSRISMFDDFKIPRIIGTQQTYGSEAHLVIEHSDTLPSDYPSESHSEVDEERSLPVSSAGSYETKAFIHQQVEQRASSSLYSETINEADRETVTETNAAATATANVTAHRPRSLASLNTEMTETRSLTEVTDATHAKYRVASMLAPSTSIHPSVSHVTEDYREQRREEVEPLVEPVVASRRPEITTHEVDDVFLRTVTEKKTIEDIERHRRQVTEYHARQQPLPDPKWDVTIRNYPMHELPPPPPEWENFSDVSSASNLTIANEPVSTKIRDEPIDVHIQPTYTVRGADISRSTTHDLVNEEVERGAASWYNLERVLEPQYAAEFTDDERKKWREIITTESTLKTLLTEAIVKEDYELIRKDARYVSLFPPAKWDVIIRIVSPVNAGSASSSAHGKSGQRYKRGKSTEWDNRSRRSSLPTLYEYESDGGSSARTFGQDQLRSSSGPGVSGIRIRKLSSTTRGGSEADLRSMSEMTVRDFARLDRDDQTSLSSFEGDSLVRSLSQPSLARSGSEFTEHWGLPARNLPHWGIDDEPCSSTETTPRPHRREVLPVSSYEEVTRQGRTIAGQSVGVGGVGGGSGGRVRHGATTTTSSSYATTTRYTEREIHMQNAVQSRSSWFHDDSEPEMQI